MRRWIFIFLCLLAAKGVFAEEKQPSSNSAVSVKGKETAAKDMPVAVSPNTPVFVKLSIIEVAVTKLRRQGVNFEKMLEEQSLASASPQQKPTEKDINLFGELPPENFSCCLRKEDDKFFLKVKKLVKDDLAKILAQPTLVTANGRAASFNSGGEIPVPVPQSAGTTTIEWKQYGVRVDFCPIVLDKETVRLEVRPRVSELDESHSVSIQGTKIPGLISREVDTALDMKTNQIAVISGARAARVVKDPSLPGEKQESSKSAAASSPETEEFAWLFLIKPEIGEPMK